MHYRESHLIDEIERAGIPAAEIHKSATALATLPDCLTRAKF